MFVAALDTCVLWPGLRRDFLLSLAIEGLYRPIWSEQVLDELHYCEIEKLTRRGRDRIEATAAADRLVDRMRTQFRDALISDHEDLVHSVGLPDPDDEHVVAAAVRAGAQSLVTENLRHFPADLLPPELSVLSPQDFADATVRVDPERALSATIAMAERRSNTPLDTVLETLESRYGMNAAAATLRWALTR